MRIFLKLFFTLGLLLVSWPTLLFITGPSLDEMKKERAAIAAWPSVTGVLDEVRFQKEWRLPKGATWYTAEVSYRYAVDGRAYQGTGLGIQAYQSRDWKKLEARMGRLVAPENIAQREEGTKGYTEPGTAQGEPRTIWHIRNQPVTVYYDPKKPDASLLDTQDHDPPTLLKQVTPLLVSFLFGLLIMTVTVLKWKENEGPVADAGFRQRSKGMPGALSTVRKSKPAQDMDWLEAMQEGDRLLQGRHYQDALSLFEHAYHLSPGEAGTTHSEIRMKLGSAECLIALGRPNEARRALEDAHRWAKDLPGADELIERGKKLQQQADAALRP